MSPGIAFRAGQGSYTKQKDATYGYRPKPHPTLEARPRFEWLVRWGGGAGPRHFAAAGSCAGASKRGELHCSLSPTARSKFFFQGLLALLPLWWVCEVRIWGISGPAELCASTCKVQQRSAPSSPGKPAGADLSHPEDRTATTESRNPNLTRRRDK